MSGESLANLGYLALLLVALGGAYLASHRQSVGKSLQMALVWGMIFLGCIPTTSKSKTIKVLKKETYECPTCSYKWSVAKTSDPASTADKTATVIEPAKIKRKIQPLPPIIRASHSKLRLRKETDFTAPTK